MTIVYFILFTFILGLCITFLTRILFPHKITIEEMGISLGVLCITTVITIVCTLIPHTNTQLLHGYVTGKSRDKVSCDHSYEICNTVGSGKNTRQSCTTYYDHSFDYEWNIETNVGKITIGTVDPQGVIMPPRYTSTNINDPVTVESSYTDYIEGSNSIYNLKDNISPNAPYNEIIPNYPKVKDYYNTNLVLSTMKVEPKLIKELNTSLRKTLSRIASKTQNNTIIVFTDHPQDFGEFLRRSWNNGRKNDGVIVIGLDKNIIKWVFVWGWSKNNLYQTNLQSELLEVNTLTFETIPNIMTIIEKNTLKYFDRQEMSKFKYLQYDRPISTYFIIFAVILQVFVNVGLGIFNYKNDY